MKRYLIVLSLIVGSLAVVAQDCNLYFPGKKGAVLSYSYYNKSGKEESSSKITVTDVTGNRFSLSAEAFDKKGNSSVKFDYTAWCENGDFYIDMKSMMGSMNLQNLGDFKIESTNLQFPSHMSAGQTLNDASINLKTEGPVSMSVNTQFTNRKVEGFEKLTTPAGTFDCVKISYNTFAKVMIVKTEGSAVEWYSKDVGLIRSETYDKKGKLLSYNELTSIE